MTDETTDHGQIEAVSIEQRVALHLLGIAQERATASGLFDILQCDCDYPNSINDVCDAVSFRLALYPQMGKPMPPPKC